jgi:endonuclease/exonuclease/phosphatase family metal-dependent hydrolase
MKIITLNTWGGRIHKPLLDFIRGHENVDVFCFQEVYNKAEGKESDYLEDAHDLHNDLNAILEGHNDFFAPHLEDWYGLSMFVNKKIKVKDSGEEFVYKHKDYYPEGNVGNHARNIQYIQIEHNSNNLTVINFHGLWTGKGKTDSEDRIKQSENIANFIKRVKGEVVLCGDFNLLPNTESIKILEDSGLKNLITENNIKSTRTSHYKKKDKFADYIFVSEGIKVKDFEVMSEEVSDHSPLYIEVEYDSIPSQSLSNQQS